MAAGGQGLSDLWTYFGQIAKKNKFSAGGSEVQIVATDGDFTNVEAIRSGLNGVKPFEGVSFDFVTDRSGTDVSIYVGKNVPIDTVIVVSAKDRGYKGGQLQIAETVAALALATYSFLFYPKSKAVYDELVRLFEKLTPLRMVAQLTHDAAVAVIAAIQV